MITYPECTTCLATGYLDEDVTCPRCQGFGDLRCNVLPDLSDEDYDMLEGSQRHALQEVFGLS